MAGYTRQSSFADGDTITAALFNDEYNQLVNAFNNSTGHSHDGTAASGPVIGLIGDVGETSPNNKVLIDTTNNYIEFYIEVSSAPVQQLYIADGAIVPVTDNDIDLGTSSLEFKNLYLDGTAKIDTLTVDEAATIGTTLGVTGATTLSSTLAVTGATTLSSTLAVTGATTLSSTLAVTGTSTLTGNVTTTNNLSVGGNLTVTGNATISGNLTFGDADTDTITIGADVASNITPDVDDTYDLGTSTKEWRNLYIDGTANIDSLVADTADINAGTIDNTVIGGTTAVAGSFTTATATTGNITTVNATTVDTTNIEVTNIKAKDGTSAGSIADSTGVVTLASSVLTTTDINGGTIDNTAIGGTTASSGAFTTLTASGATTLNGNVTLGDAATDNVVFNADVNSSIIPNTDDTYDLGSVSQEWRNLYIDGTANIDSLVADTADINGGTIDGVTIGGTTAGAVTFTDLSDGTITIAGFVDEDTMVSDSATLVPTQQSVKAYVDSQVTAQDLDFQGDTGGALSIDLDSETLTIAGGTGIDTSGATNTLTVSIDSTVATLTGTQTLTNKTLTSPVINTGVSGTAVLDDDTFATASATTLATSESIKAYVDAVILTEDTLAEMNDVNITSPADGSLLFYDTGTSMWIDNVVSGDITIADTGVAAISSGVIVNDDINASAAISVSKTALVDGTGLTLTGDTLSVDASQTQITAVGTIGTGTWQGTAIADAYVADNLTIDGGTVDNSVIGGSTPAAGTFTTLTANTSITGTLATAAQTNITSVGTLSSLTVSGDLTVDTNTLFVDSTNNRVGILDATPAVTLDIGSATDAIFVPSGTTAQRPGTPSNGYLRYNSDDAQFEGYADGAWGAIAGSGSGSAMEQQILSGDGSTTGFTLTSAPTSENNLLVFVDGVFQAQDTYSVSGTTLTFSTAPANGRVITVYHILSNISGSNMIVDSMTGDGSDVTLTLSVAPVSENNVQVYIDGVYQSKSNYSISGTTLTFTTAPPSGTAVEAITHTQTSINTPANGSVAPASIASGDFYFDTDTLYIDATNNRVGIGTDSPAAQVHINNGTAGTPRGSGFTKLLIDNDNATYLEIQTGSSNTGDILFSDGSTGNYGVIGYDHATDAMRILTASTERMRIDSSGDVQLGNSIGSGTYNGSINAVANKSTGAIIKTRNGDGNKHWMVLGDSNIEYGSIGLTSPTGTGLLQIQGESGTVFNTSGGTERMRIASDGEIQMFGGNSVQSNYTGANQCIGVYSSSIAAFAISRASVNAGLYVSSTDAGSGNVDFISFHTGTTERARLKWTGSTISLANTSDYRLKENVIDLQNATERLNGLRPVQFDWIDNGFTSEGFIAHEVSDYLPNAVSGTKDEVWLEEDCIDENEDKVGQPKYQQIHREEFIPLLVKALQESNAKIAELEARIETLENA